MSRTRIHVVMVIEEWDHDVVELAVARATNDNLTAELAETDAGLEIGVEVLSQLHRLQDGEALVVWRRP